MITLSTLVEYANASLKIKQFNDYCPNGLQIEGKQDISRIITGVTASEALIKAAIDTSADVILVHHGYFWKGDSPVISGIARKRIGLLLEANISLIAYHLPLDAHPVWGNNACLGERLSFIPGQTLSTDGMGLTGVLESPCSVKQLTGKLTTVLNRQPQVVSTGDQDIRTVGWCTGAAQDMIVQAASLGLDAFISGEISERTYHQAHELGIHYFAAGHHATERYGVQAFGLHLAEHFGISHQYIEIDNPV